MKIYRTVISGPVYPRESISYLRKRQFVVYDDDVLETGGDMVSVHEGLLDVEYVQHLIDELPEGYKTVFLLYAIEGYGHKEISEMLEISEGTSKSQLFKARKLLQENLSLRGMSHNTCRYGIGEPSIPFP